MPGTQALDRGLSLLALIAEAPAEGLRLADLAAAAELNPPTVHRLLGSLRRHGLIEQVPGTKRLRLGLRFFEWSGRSHDTEDLVRTARPHLLQIVARTGDCAFLMMRSGYRAYCIDRCDGDYSIHTLTGRIGGSTLLGVGTGSAVILANLPDRERNSVLDQNKGEIAASNQVMPTEHTLSQIRQKGYFYQPDATMVGVVGVAVPLALKPGTPGAALSTGALQAKMNESHLEVTLAALNAAASAIRQTALGPGAASG